MPTRPRLTAFHAILVGIPICLAGCNEPNSTPRPSSVAEAESDGQAEAIAEGKAEFLDIKAKFAEVIEEASARYHPLVYRFDEDLLAKMDTDEARLNAKTPSADPSQTTRLIPEVDPQEEDDHLRESMKRWAEKTKKNFRAELDALKADLAAVDKTKAFHPEFHKKFSAVFDDFVPIEVLEMRERRNRSIHQRVRSLLDPFRTSRPNTVSYFEKQIANPTYQDPDAKR